MQSESKLSSSEGVNELIWRLGMTWGKVCFTLTHFQRQTKFVENAWQIICLASIAYHSDFLVCSLCLLSFFVPIHSALSGVCFLVHRRRRWSFLLHCRCEEWNPPSPLDSTLNSEEMVNCKEQMIITLTWQMQMDFQREMQNGILFFKKREKLKNKKEKKENFRSRFYFHSRRRCS